MFIKFLHLRDWLSHANTELALDKLVCIRGENGSGKTSIEQALEMLFTGRSESTNDKGAGSRDLIRRGSDKAYITAEILNGSADAIRMRCSLTEKSGRTVQVKKEADPSWTGSDWLGSLAMQREIYDCLINSRYFVGMDDARQKTLLASIILPVSVKFEPWVESAINQCGLSVDWSIKAFDLIALAYDKAYKERTMINRIIKEWKEPEQVPTQGGPDLNDIRARLGERQNERTRLAVERQRILDRFEQSKSSSEKLRERISALIEKIETEHDRRKTVAKDCLSKPQIRESEKLALGAERAKKLEAEIQQNAGALAEVRRTLAKFSDIGEAGACPTCTQRVTDAEFEHIAQPFITTQDGLLMRERELQDARKALGDYQGAQRCLDAHAQAEKNLKLVDGHIADIEKDIEQFKQEIENNPDVPEPDTEGIDAQIADLDARIQKGNAALSVAIQNETNRRHYDEAMDAKKKLDTKQKLLERLVDYFGPKGIQAKLLDEHVGAFQDSMNAVLSVWQFQAHLQFEPYQFGISFETAFRGRGPAFLRGTGPALDLGGTPGKGPEVYALKTISASQKAMFAIAFQVALAKTTCINFVVADAVDIFLDTNRGMLYKALIASELDQAIVMQSDLRREIPKVQNAVFYTLALDRSGEVPTTIAERL
jgi:tetratricopeptide (TPR) repeat protein